MKHTTRISKESMQSLHTASDVNSGMILHQRSESPLESVLTGVLVLALLGIIMLAAVVATI